MDQNILLLLLIAVLGALGALIYITLKKKPEEKPQDNSSILMMQEQLKELRQTLQNFGTTVDAKMGDSTKMFQQQFGQNAGIIKDVSERLTKLDETNRQVVGFADQLQDLQNILKNPKQRGILGEYYLETVLKNVLPPSSYQLQYKFKDGLIADAVIFLEKQILPIDSKFSLENYNRIIEERDPSERERLEKAFKQDLKNRIDETSKYIKTTEKTTEYALMFIPAEAIYYDLLVNQVGAIKVNTRDLIEYAHHEKHVIIVSPTTFHVYLRLFMEGLRRQQMGESIQQVIKRIGELDKHIKACDEYLQKLGKNLGTTVNMYNYTYKEFGKMDKDVFKIAGKAGEIEPMQIEGPATEDSDK